MSVEQAKPGLRRIILDHIGGEPGLSDRELTDRIFDSVTHPSQVNQACRQLAARGAIERKARDDGKIGNFPTGVEAAMDLAPTQPRASQAPVDGLPEDEVKRHLVRWLEFSGWRVEVAWGKARGIDIVGRRGEETWIIEAKGAGSLQPMRVNYFIALLGATLQRMSDPRAKYSIALPDMAQFRGLWNRLPELAKRRTGISALFVAENGVVEEA